jgi:RNA polymerase sigma factor (sigma-70 family)
MGLVSLPEQQSESSGRPDVFATTRWSVIVRARDSQSPEARAALERLCETYWYPLYCYVRRRGHSPEDTQDLTQEFFARLLGNGGLALVDRTKGKFRSFLLASMNNLLANEWNRSQRQKRGGGAAHFSLDAAAAEERYQFEPADQLTPEVIFERRWAETLIDRVTRRLQTEFAETGMAERFEGLKVFLLAGDEPTSYAEAAAKIGITEGAVRTAIYRMRQRYGELFRAELAETVTSSLELEEELRHFLSVLGG